MAEVRKVHDCDRRGAPHQSRNPPLHPLSIFGLPATPRPRDGGGLNGLLDGLCIPITRSPLSPRPFSRVPPCCRLRWRPLSRMRDGRRRRRRPGTTPLRTVDDHAPPRRLVTTCPTDAVRLCRPAVVMLPVVWRWRRWRRDGGHVGCGGGTVVFVAAREVMVGVGAAGVRRLRSALEAAPAPDGAALPPHRPLCHHTISGSQLKPVGFRRPAPPPSPAAAAPRRGNRVLSLPHRGSCCRAFYILIPGTSCTKRNGDGWRSARASAPPHLHYDGPPRIDIISKLSGPVCHTDALGLLKCQTSGKFDLV